MNMKTVLFVDDDPSLLASLERGLMDEPYKMLFARSGEEALEILKEKEVHMVVADMRMPGMSGLELLKIVKKEYPHIMRLVLSGYTQIATMLTAITQEKILKYVTKPFNLQKLRGLLRSKLEEYEEQKKGDLIR